MSDKTKRSVHSRNVSIEKWHIFSHLKESVIADIRLAFVFGPLGSEALYVTKDDHVMSMGSSARIGSTKPLSIFTPQSISALRKKGVLKMVFGDQYVVAMTSAGEVLTWGQQTYYQDQTNAKTPTKIGANLINRIVIDIASGAHHVLALTSDGEVYGWGLNTNGQIAVAQSSTSQHLKPSKIALTNKIKTIACGSNTSVVITVSGEVYVWGHDGTRNQHYDNYNGRYYYGNPNPTKVSSLDLTIDKVVCGNEHTLLLSVEGIIYAFGTNNYGQLGTGTVSNAYQKDPLIIGPELGLFVDIGAVRYNNLSAALSIDGKVYIWGQCKGLSVSVPTEVQIQSIDDTFAVFGTPAVTFRPLELKYRSSRLNKSLSKAFDDIQTTDFQFIVEGKSIHVHKAILRIRCEHFKTMFGHNWDKNNRTQEIIKGFSYPVYYAFLQYLYTDEVVIAAEEGIGLLDLANSYDETDLKEKCERLLIEEINVENVAIIYSEAIKFSAKSLENYSFRFALHHLTQVVVTDAFDSLDEKLYKNFMKKVAFNRGFKY